MLLVLGQDTHRFRCPLCCKRSNPEVEILLKEPMPPNFMVQATEEMMARRAGGMNWFVGVGRLDKNR